MGQLLVAAVDVEVENNKSQLKDPNNCSLLL